MVGTTGAEQSGHHGQNEKTANCTHGILLPQMGLGKVTLRFMALNLSKDEILNILLYCVIINLSISHIKTHLLQYSSS